MNLFHRRPYDRPGCDIYAKGTVFTEGESQAGASGHRNTWKYAYGIEPVREWLFQQIKD